MEIKEVAPGKLKPYEKNHKVHGKEQVSRLAQSIKEFGWTQPIVVDEKMSILIGHGRHQAALELKLEKIPVRVLTGLSEEKKKALRVIDNRSGAEAEWDLAALTSELEELEKSDFELFNFLDAPTLDEFLKIEEVRQQGQNFGGDDDDENEEEEEGGEEEKKPKTHRNLIIAGPKEEIEFITKSLKEAMGPEEILSTTLCRIIQEWKDGRS